MTPEDKKEMMSLLEEFAKNTLLPAIEKIFEKDSRINKETR